MRKQANLRISEDRHGRRERIEKIREGAPLDLFL